VEHLGSYLKNYRDNSGEFTIKYYRKVLTRKINRKVENIIIVKLKIGNKLKNSSLFSSI
jgi:hypothetical protein